MRIVVAMDSFKGSLTSLDAGCAVQRGIEKAFLPIPDQTPVVKVFPLADGGEGTVAALIGSLGGTYETVKVRGPLKGQVEAGYGIVSPGNGPAVAVIEMSAAAGLWLVPEKERNPLYTTTYGVGELILHALLKGCRKFLVGIGGSATNDGGVGMLAALGFEFRDKMGRKTGICGKDLNCIFTIHTERKQSLLDGCTFRVACDVNNPLCGPNGAAYVFGPQKGASPSEIRLLDKGLANLADVASRSTAKNDYRNVPGAGAAGGVGYAFIQFLNGKLESGAGMIIDAIGLENEIRNADLVITGEGRMDDQTAMGKAPWEVARLAGKYGKKAIAFCGSIAPSASCAWKDHFDLCIPVTPPGASLERASEWLEKAVCEYFKTKGDSL